MKSFHCLLGFFLFSLFLSLFCSCQSWPLFTTNNRKASSSESVAKAVNPIESMQIPKFEEPSEPLKTIPVADETVKIPSIRIEELTLERAKELYYMSGELKPVLDIEEENETGPNPRVISK